MPRWAADLAIEFGWLEGQAFVAGDAIRKPWGIMADTNVSGFVANGHATTLQSDGIISLIYALPAFNRSRVAFIMNGSTLAAPRSVRGLGLPVARSSPCRRPRNVLLPHTVPRCPGDFGVTPIYLRERQEEARGTQPT